MTDHDQLLKQVLRAFLDELVGIVAPSEASRLVWEKREDLDKETFTDFPKGKHRYLDVLSKVPSKEKKNELILVHTEVEGKAGEEIKKRMWRYFMQLQLRHDLPVLPIVLFLSGGEAGIHWNTQNTLIFEREISRFSFVSFGLSQTLAEEYLARPEALCAALAAKMKPGLLSRAKLKFECLKKIALAKLNEAKRFLLLNFVQTYLPLEGNEAKEYYDLLEKEPSKEVKSMQLTWADQVKAEGLAEGEAKGRAEALLLVLKKRKIALSAEEKERVLSCRDIALLERWLDRALSASSSQEIFAPPKKSPRKKTSKT